MKYLFLSLGVFIKTISFCQSTDASKVFMVVEQMPEYPGGDDSMMKFIQKNIQYPDFERANDIQGRVVVGFVVNEDGSLSDVSVMAWIRKQ